MRIAFWELSRVWNRLLKVGIVCLFAAVAFVSWESVISESLSAQENPTGSISGTVRSASGISLSGAKLTITNKSTGQTSVVTTDAAGKYSSPQTLAPTDYSVRVEVRSFISKVQLTEVKAGQVTNVDFVLDPEPLPGVVPAERTSKFPFSDPNFLRYAQVEPGVQSQDAGTIDPTKNGFSSISLDSRFGRVPRIEVDGVDVTDETVGSTTQNIPTSAVREFHVGGLLAPIADQLGSAGSVNFITRSGSSDLHGELFGAYGNGDVLSASLPGGHSNLWGRQRFGGDLGGALSQDKLFFFLSAERNKLDLVDPVLLGGAFIPLSPSAEIREPFRDIQTTGRLDYLFSGNTHAFYRFSYNQSKDTEPFQSGANLQPFLATTNTPSHALGVDFNSEGFTHSFRFEYLKYRNAINDRSFDVGGVANPAPVGIDIGGGARSSCQPGSIFCSGPSDLAPQQTIQSDSQVRYDGTHPWKAHIFHFGVGYNHILASDFAAFHSIAPTLADDLGIALPASIVTGSTGDPTNPLNYPVEWAFLGNGQGSTSERSQFGLPGGGQRDNRLTAYLGDVWKVRRNLDLSYGVTWIRDDGRSDSDLGEVTALNAWGPHLGDPVRQPNYNFGPQLGFSWDPHFSGKTVIRGGIGLYYENAIFNNLLFDRPLRLQQGSFLATPAACVGGSAGSIQWPVSPGIAGTAIAGGAGIVNANGTVSPTWCGQSIGLAAPSAIALQQAYQIATSSAGSSANPSFIGNPGAFAGPNENGLSLLAPNYQTPRTVQMNLGLQHELRPGLMFTFDYVRDVSTRTLLGIDVNHGGAAGTFSAANAVADRDAAQLANGCLAGTNQVSCMVANLGPAGALSAYGAEGIGGPAQVTGGAACPFCAFPGVQPNLGVNVMNFPVGRSVYSGIDVGLKQQITNFSVRGIERATFQVSYSHSRYVSQTNDSQFVNQATDFNNPDRFTGPTDLDRTHQVSVGAYFELKHSARLSFMGHFASPLPVTLFLPQDSGGAEILVSDVTGDGTTGDILPDTNVGSYMRRIKPGGVATFIQGYNNVVAGTGNPATPAGNMLINGGVFSLQELELMGGVQQPLAAAVSDVAGLGWLKTLDVRLGWSHTFGERIVFEPSVSFFNLLNFANFDLPGRTQSGVLNYGAGSLSPFATTFQPQNTVGGTSPNLLDPSGRTNRASFQSGMNAQGAPRTVEWGVKISF